MWLARFREIVVLVFFAAIILNCLSIAKCTCKEEAKRKVADLLDDIEEFYNQKFSDVYTTNQRLLMKVAVHPSFLDFGNQPLSTPKRLEVVLKNLDSDHSFEIVATFGTHEAFVWSKLNQTSVSPLSSASFNITFLPYKLGAFEGSIYISTTRGQIKYQVFGTAYIDTEYPVPFVEVDYDKKGSAVASLHTFNPHPHPIQVGSIALYIPPSKTIQSTIENNETKIFQNDPREPLILAPHETTNLFTFDLPPSAAFCVTLVSYCHELSCSSDCPSSGCVQQASSEAKTRQLEDFPQVTVIPTSYTLAHPELGIIPQSSLLHFGTVSQASGAVTKPIKLINALNHDVSITRLEIDVFDPAVSSSLSVRSLPAASLVPGTIATLTVSPANASISRVLTGFVTVVTNVKTATVKIPFYAKVIHGLLVIHQRRVLLHDQSPPQFRFDYILSNQADIPISVTKPRLPRAYRSLIQATYPHSHQCLILVQPGSEVMLLSLSLQNDTGRTRVSGSIPISTNISMQEFAFDVFSGDLEVRIEGARLLDGVYNLGTVLLNQQGSNSIVLYNRNPLEIEVETLGVSTSSTASDAWRLVNERIRSGAGCATMCFVHIANEACFSCATKLAEGQSSKLSLLWGGIPQTAIKTGFIVLKSTYQHWIRPFRFGTTQGQLSMLPNPMVVNDLFPGKTVRRNVIIQSSYSTPVKLTRLQLETHLSESKQDAASFVRLYRQPPMDQVTETAFTGMLLEPQQPTIVATVLFDPASACVDVLSVPQPWNERADPQQEDLPVCHTGFSLDSAQGLLWLASMTTNETIYPDSLNRFRAGLLQSAATYAQLRTAWMAHTAGSTTSTHSLETYLSLGLDEQDQGLIKPDANLSSIYWADLSVSLIWPRLVSSRKQPTKRPVAQCVIRTSGNGASVNSDQETTTLEQALRAHFPPTIPGEPVQCDLIVTNPSDRPLFVQPILLDTVYTMRSNATPYANYTARNVEVESLVSFLHALGVPASTEHVTKLTRLLSGTFHVQSVNGSQTTGWIYDNLPAPSCCPILLLPANGQLLLRLTFTPDSLGPVYSPEASSVTQLTSYNLLFLRNNLTALEPVWLNARLGKATVNLGLLNTDAAGSGSGNMETEGEKNAVTVESINLLVRGEWNTVWIADNQTTTAVDNDSSVVPQSSTAIGHWQSSIVRSSTTPKTPVSQIKLDFDFSERAFWPFCTNSNDLQMAYTFPEHVHSDLLDTSSTKSSSITRLLRTINHPGELLASLSLRRRLVLINSGDVPVELRAIILVHGPGPTLVDNSAVYSNDAQSTDAWFQIASGFSCAYRGFRIHPCLTYRPQKFNSNAIRASQPKNDSVVLAPGEQFLIDLRYRPDFVYSGTAARLWIVAHPHNSGPVDSEQEKMLAHCLNGHKDAMQCLQTVGLYRLTELQLNAIFPRGFLRMCLTVLPRPWIEYILWVIVVFLFTISLLGVMLMGCIDANRLWTAYERVRSRINRVPFNTQPNPTRVLRFDRFVTDPFESSTDNSVSQCTTETAGLKAKSGVSLTDQPVPTKKEHSSGPVVSDSTTELVLSKMKSISLLSSSSTQAEPITLDTAIGTAAAKSAVLKSVRNAGALAAGKEEVLSSNSDEDPWLMSRSSFKPSSKSTLLDSTSPLLKSTNSLDDRKISRSARRHDASKANISETVPDRTSGRAKKKTARSGDLDDRESPSLTEQSRTGLLSSVDDTHDASVISNKSSPMRRPARKVANSSSTAASSRSKVSDAPKTEAGIAAAVRATMRLAEESGSQARRKASNQATDRSRGARNKRNPQSGHSSASSSSGPDQDPVPTKTRSHAVTSAPMGTQPDKSSMPNSKRPDQGQPPPPPPPSQQQQHPHDYRSSPMNISKRFGRHGAGLPHGSMTEQLRHGHSYDQFEHDDRYGRTRAVPSYKTRTSSDFQTIGLAPYPVLGTALDLDLYGEYVPELDESALIGPHLGLCWPAYPVAFDRTHLSAESRTFHDPNTERWSFLRSPPGPHLDDAVVEVSGTNMWDSSLPLERSRSMSAQEAMDQIAEDSRAFAESLLCLSPTATNRGRSARPDGPTSKQAHPVQPPPGLSATSGRTGPNFTELASTQDGVGNHKPLDSDRTRSWDLSTSLIESLKRPSSLVYSSLFNGSDSGQQTTTTSSCCSCSTATSSLSNLNSGIFDSNLSMDMNRARLLLAPFFPELLLPTSNSSEVCAPTDNHRRNLDVLDQPSVDQTGISFTDYFYELPQITMARRMSMLEHEGRQSKLLQQESISLIPPTTSGTHDVDLATGLIDDVGDAFERLSSDESLQPRTVKRTQSESDTGMRLSAGTPASAPQRPCTLPGLMEAQQRMHPSSGPPSFRSSSIVSVTPTPTAKQSSDLMQTAIAEAVAYQPWKPIDAISKADLFMNLGLDDTDQLLAFGPDFSYHNAIQATDPEWLDDQTPTGTSVTLDSYLPSTSQTSEERNDSDNHDPDTTNNENPSIATEDVG